ncbi:MAG: tetrahydrofolate dehydrogenase/cyclohydrolase catalytic domain-containing protein, partial [Patescibacteria group bacterium]
MIIDGKAIASRLIGELKAKLAAHPIDKFMGAVLVGENSASLNFLKQKERVAKELGIDFRLYKLPEDTTNDKLREEVGRLSRVKNCGGFI